MVNLRPLKVILSGYSTRPNLNPIEFSQILDPSNAERHLENKQTYGHYLGDFDPSYTVRVCEKLGVEGPDVHSALKCLPEDFIFYEPQSLKVRLMHIAAPNHWDPGMAYFQDVWEMHKDVPGFNFGRDQFVKLSCGLRNRVYERYAWGFDCTDQLSKTDNHSREKRFLRIERQTLSYLNPLVMFTIRTYFYALEEMSGELQEAITRATASMTDEQKIYKGIC